MGSIPGLGRFPWRRAWHPTLVFLPRESSGERSLVGYNPCSCKELGTAEQITGKYISLEHSEAIFSRVINVDLVMKG